LSDTAEIRKQNKCKILKIMRQGGNYTKQELSVKTGLSTATCNTLLNVLADSGEVIGEKKQLNEVGRNTIVYHINDNYESILCICFELLSEIRRIFTRIISPSGKLLYDNTEIVEKIECSNIVQSAEKAIEQFKNITQIIIGTPSISQHGCIKHCDIPELEGANLVEVLKSTFQLPVSIENDMHLKAYGYYKLNGLNKNIITLMNFHANVLPGTATIYKGTVIKGKNCFAGMVGFLPYGMPADQQLKLLSPETCIPLISKAAASIIAVINPDEMVFTGNLIDTQTLNKIYNECLESIPMEYMPKFSLVNDFEMYYTMGMYHTAIDKKEKLK